MKNGNDLSRREFMFGMATTLLASHAINKIGLGIPDASVSQVDWEEVLNKVIGDRNAALSGFSSGPVSYAVGSPEWCMEEVLAADGFLSNGGTIHV
jgi:hypothetical protein